MKTIICLFGLLGVLQFSFGFAPFQDEEHCFQLGECKNSDVLNYTEAFNEFDCLNQCKANDLCQWFTYSPAFVTCFLYTECVELDTEHCQNCLSGHRDCVPEKAMCSVPGKCLDNVLFFREVTSESACLNMCKDTNECLWYTFNYRQMICILLSGCAVLDEASENHVSGEERCTEGLSKLLVAIGSNDTDLDEVEIIDLSPSGTSCQLLTNFPIKIQYAMGGLTYEDKPIICGGFPKSAECYTYRDSAWVLDYSLDRPRYMTAMTKSPFPDDGSILFTAGGFPASRLISSEVLTEKGWRYSNELPVGVFHHCMVLINSTSVIIAGGYQDEALDVSNNTYVFNSVTFRWSEGPIMNIPRAYLSCAMIRRSSDSQDKSIIAIGGENYSDGDLQSSEILDTTSSSWRMGPQLPIGITNAALIEHPAGGVVLVGGISNRTSLESLFHLSHADAVWEELPQKLKTPRYSHTAFLVPDEITDCSRK